MAETIKIGGELESMATGKVVAAASAIKDKVKNKYQGEINAETDAALDDRYTKSQTYSKTELNNMITTPNQQYVSVTANSQTTAVTDVLPATGAADTTYRVGNWNGTQYNDSVFSEYAWNGSAYIKLSTKSQVGEVYDISANHADTKYADLAAALGTNGANIPQNLRKGGMSVKYVQSSDNKYVQYMCKNGTWSSEPTNWEKVNNVSVVQNTETGHIDIEVDSNTIEVASVDDYGRNVLEISKLDSYVNFSGNGVVQTPSETLQGYYDINTRKFVSYQDITFKKYQVVEGDYYRILNKSVGGSSVASLVLLKNGEVLYLGSYEDNAVFKVQVNGYDTIGLMTSSSSLTKYDGVALDIPNNSIGNDKLIQNSIEGNKLLDNSIDANKLYDNTITIDKIQFKNETYGKNLFNKDAAVPGYINYDGYIDSSVTSLSTSDFIPITPGESYYFNDSDNSEMRFYLFFNENKQALSATFAENTHLATAPEGAAYIRLTCITSRLDSAQLEIGTSATSYVPYVPPKKVINLENIPVLDTGHIGDHTITGDKLAGDISFPSMRPALSLCGKDSIKLTASSISSGNSLQITDFPQYLKANGIVTFSALLSSFDEIKVGFGTVGGGIQAVVDSTNLYIHKINSSSPEPDVFGSYVHGLTISDFIGITFDNDFFKPKVVISTKSGIFVKEMAEFPSIESYGYPIAIMGESTSVTNAELRASSDKFNKPIWVVGDSYTSLYDERWTKQLIKTIGVDKFLIIGLAGGGSGNMFADLQKASAFGTPKFLIWCLGMNDSYAGWSATLEHVISYCDANGIELILQTIPIPNLETSNNQVQINNAIRESGYRYIDACGAMCHFNGTTWEWYSDFTDEEDKVHPNVLGAKVLAARFLSDFPEFMQ